MDNINMDYSLLSGKHVLLCEDNVLNAEIVVRFLKFKSCYCDVAVNGAEAVKKFIDSENGRYDIILMDIRMPVKSGLDAAKEIRASAHPQSCEIPIVATSASFFEEEVDEAIKAGMNECLSKPVEADVLYNTIIKHLKTK